MPQTGADDHRERLRGKFFGEDRERVADDRRYPDFAAAAFLARRRSPGAVVVRFLAGRASVIDHGCRLVQVARVVDDRLHRDSRSFDNPRAAASAVYALGVGPLAPVNHAKGCRGGLRSVLARCYRVDRRLDVGARGSHGRRGRKNPLPR